MNPVEILDCTLRDGSYLINFQFNTNDTYYISKLLDEAGLKYIEVGHGLGLDAGKDKFLSLENDIAYIKAAKQAVKKAKVGVFYIPGIGNEDSIKKAVEAGLDFIRVGVNAPDFDDARETLEFAKSQGLEVWLNLMKTYTVKLPDWEKICTQLSRFSCDHLAVVDSAGGMLPQDVREYCRIAKEKTPFSVGFHGHNNMQLAIANCLAAIEGGATIVDGTLFGMGRSGGNANTEILAAIFRREKIPSGNYDVESLIEIANDIIAPMARSNLGDSAVELAAGVNQFHSSFFKIVKNECDKDNVSIFRTILNLPVESREKVTQEMVASTIKTMPKTPTRSATHSLHKSNTLYLSDLDEMARYLKEITAKTNRKVAMSLSQTPSLNEKYRISQMFPLEDSIVGHVEVSNVEQIAGLVESLKGLVNTWVFDQNLKSVGETKFKNVRVFYYNESQIERNVLNNEILNSNRNVFYFIPKDGVPALLRSNEEEVPGAGNLIIVNSEVQRMTTEFVDLLSEGDQVILTHKCDIEEACWKKLDEKKVTPYRLNYTLALAYEVEKILKYKEIIHDNRGKIQRDGIEIVSGGVLARAGSVIVDNLIHPNIVLGLTDGKGGVKKIEDKVSELNSIKNMLFTELR